MVVPIEHSRRYLIRNLDNPTIFSNQANVGFLNSVDAMHLYLCCVLPGVSGLGREGVPLDKSSALAKLDLDLLPVNLEYSSYLIFHLLQCFNAL